MAFALAGEQFPTLTNGPAHTRARGYNRACWCAQRLTTLRYRRDSKHVAPGLTETFATCLLVDPVELEDHFAW